MSLFQRQCRPASRIFKNLSKSSSFSPSISPSLSSLSCTLSSPAPSSTLIAPRNSSTLRPSFSTASLNTKEQSMEEAPVSSYADNMNDAGRETIVEEQTSGKTSDINEKEKQVEMTNFLGAKSAYTETLKITEAWEPMECFRRLDLEGRVIDPEYKVSLSDEELIKMFKTMTRLNVMDNIFYDVQRQGRIAFYMTSFGEEATHIGSAAALHKNDLFFGQYRESGVFMYRGFTTQDFANQCFSNTHDLGKGRQMPIHYGSWELNCHTISSPLATQMPHASGAAYAFKREQKDLPIEEKNIVICYFGDGAASEGDFHTALNFAATLECPVLFFCRNNGYAISTPVHEQYRGDGIASRGAAYGMPTIRVDGNDMLAVYDATKAAKQHILETGKPMLIEAMTYRGGHHSTSDDSSAYRSQDEIDYWMQEESALTRARLYLEERGLWDSEKEAECRVEARADVLSCLGKAENVPKPAASQLFTDVYDEMPPHLVEQTKQLQDHLEKYGEHYNLDEFCSEESYVDPSIALIEKRKGNFPG